MTDREKFIEILAKELNLDRLSPLQFDGILRAMQQAADAREEWISVEDRLPEIGQNVLFITKSINEWYDNKALAGRYNGFDFATPGIGFDASYWMPYPELPKI